MPFLEQEEFGASCCVSHLYNPNPQKVTSAHSRAAWAIEEGIRLEYGSMVERLPHLYKALGSWVSGLAGMHMVWED